MDPRRMLQPVGLAAPRASAAQLSRAMYEDERDPLRLSHLASARGGCGSNMGGPSQDDVRAAAADLLGVLQHFEAVFSGQDGFVLGAVLQSELRLSQDQLLRIVEQRIARAGGDRQLEQQRQQRQQLDDINVMGEALVQDLIASKLEELLASREALWRDSGSAGGSGSDRDRRDLIRLRYQLSQICKDRDKILAVLFRRTQLPPATYAASKRRLLTALGRHSSVTQHLGSSAPSLRGQRELPLARAHADDEEAKAYSDDQNRNHNNFNQSQSEDSAASRLRAVREKLLRAARHRSGSSNSDYYEQAQQPPEGGGGRGGRGGGRGGGRASAAAAAVAAASDARVQTLQSHVRHLEEALRRDSERVARDAARTGALESELQSQAERHRAALAHSEAASARDIQRAAAEQEAALSDVRAATEKLAADRAQLAFRLKQVRAECQQEARAQFSQWQTVTQNAWKQQMAMEVKDATATLVQDNARILAKSAQTEAEAQRTSERNCALEAELRRVQEAAGSDDGAEHSGLEQQVAQLRKEKADADRLRADAEGLRAEADAASGALTLQVREAVRVRDAAEAERAAYTQEMAQAFEAARGDFDVQRAALEQGAEAAQLEAVELMAALRQSEHKVSALAERGEELAEQATEAGAALDCERRAMAEVVEAHRTDVLGSEEDSARLLQAHAEEMLSVAQEADHLRKALADALKHAEQRQRAAIARVDEEKDEEMIALQAAHEEQVQTLKDEVARSSQALESERERERERARASSTVDAGAVERETREKLQQQLEQQLEEQLKSQLAQMQAQHESALTKERRDFEEVVQEQGRQSAALRSMVASLQAEREQAEREAADAVAERAAWAKSADQGLEAARLELERLAEEAVAADARHAEEVASLRAELGAERETERETEKERERERAGDAESAQERLRATLRAEWDEAKAKEQCAACSRLEEELATTRAEWDVERAKAGNHGPCEACARNVEELALLRAQGGCGKAQEPCATCSRLEKELAAVAGKQAEWEVEKAAAGNRGPCAGCASHADEVAALRALGEKEKTDVADATREAMQQSVNKTVQSWKEMFEEEKDAAVAALQEELDGLRSAAAGDEGTAGATPLPLPLPCTDVDRAGVEQVCRTMGTLQLMIADAHGCVETQRRDIDQVAAVLQAREAASFEVQALRREKMILVRAIARLHATLAGNKSPTANRANLELAAPSAASLSLSLTEPGALVMDLDLNEDAGSSGGSDTFDDGGPPTGSPFEEMATLPPVLPPSPPQQHPSQARHAYHIEEGATSPVHLSQEISQEQDQDQDSMLLSASFEEVRLDITDDAADMQQLVQQPEAAPPQPPDAQPRQLTFDELLAVI